MQIGPTHIICTSVMAVFLIIYSLWIIRDLKRIIDRQNDTIHRLINREPVTYQEVGETPKKPSRTQYAAWGNQMVDFNDDDGEQA